MNNSSEWGFSVVQSWQSDLDRTDYRLLNLLERCDSSIFWCFGCGTCTASCPSHKFTAFNPRMILNAVRMGRTNEVREKISHCILCGKCQLVCPRNVNTRNIFYSINRFLRDNEI
jgi:heterodisulfide reductase subunit C